MFIQLTDILGNDFYVNVVSIAMFEVCQHEDLLAVKLTLTTGKEVIVKECMRQINELMNDL